MQSTRVMCHFLNIVLCECQQEQIIDLTKETHVYYQLQSLLFSKLVYRRCIASIQQNDFIIAARHVSNHQVIPA